MINKILKSLNNKHLHFFLLLIASFGVFFETSNVRSAPLLDIGFNFRNDASFVQDGPNETYVLSTDSYGSAVRNIGGNNVTFGWEQAPTGSINRLNSVGQDRRLAGVAYAGNGTSGNRDFRVDLLETGSYTIHLAMGDYGYGQRGSKIEILDGTTVLATIGPNNTTANSFYDANGVNLSAADWPTNETGKTLTFNSNILRIRLPQGAIDFDVLAHLRVVQNPPDLEAPTIPTNTSATVFSSSQINLSWTASTDNIGVAGYRVYRDGVQIAATANTSYNNTGLSPSD